MYEHFFHHLVYPCVRVLYVLSDGSACLRSDTVVVVGMTTQVNGTFACRSASGSFPRGKCSSIDIQLQCHIHLVTPQRRPDGIEGDVQWSTLPIKSRIIKNVRTDLDRRTERQPTLGQQFR